MDCLQGSWRKSLQVSKISDGLKQAPKLWHENFDKVIWLNGYRVSDMNKYVYTKFANDRGVIVFLYVDDMLILDTNLECLTETKMLLSSKFSMKDIGNADFILGIKII